MLSGVSDILLIKQKDGTFKSTPFNVHFSKKNAHKLVSIRINDALMPQLQMKLDENGDGYFLNTPETAENTDACTEKTTGKKFKRLLLRKTITEPAIGYIRSIKTNIALSTTIKDRNNLDSEKSRSVFFNNEASEKCTFSDSVEQPESLSKPNLAQKQSPDACINAHFHCRSENEESKSKYNLVTSLGSSETVYFDSKPMDQIKDRLNNNMATKKIQKNSLITRLVNRRCKKKDELNTDELNFEQISDLLKENNNKIDQIGSNTSLDPIDDSKSSSNEELNAIESIEATLDNAESKKDEELKASQEQAHVEEEQIMCILTSDQVKYLDLLPGMNEITFSINMDTKKISAFIYLWDCSDKLIICDIDGTVTKSDFRGQVLQFMGRNWAHEGVAGLFSSLQARGYKIVYLTARSFIESNITRDLLANINEDGCMMPIGPVFMNPTGLIESIQSELVHKTSHLYKIDMLATIKSLFDESYQPFYAGFGNKSTDAEAYRTVGIRDGHIFITDQAGSIDCENQLPSYLTYKLLLNFMNIYFPPNKASDKNEATNL